MANDKSCCSPIEYEEEEIDGSCPDCGTPTVEGHAAEGCTFSPVECTTCGWQPCDGSC